ncbi:BatA domain-containing protein [Flavitalea flava]
MLFLLQPIWFITAAGIGIPVIISLWNNKQGKIRKVGSVVFLEKINQQPTRNRTPSEWLLLVFRCLLLFFLALLLSGPFWKRTLKENSFKGWVLVEKEKSVTFSAYRPLIDSLLNAGYSLHEMDGEHSSFHEPGKSASYWTLFRAADRAAPAGLPFYIFAKGALNHYSGNRPVTGRDIHWYTEPEGPADTVNRWIERAWIFPGDKKQSIRILTGSSRRTGNSFTGGEMERNQANMVGGRLSVGLNGQPPVLVDTGAIRIAIYAENKYKPDCRYLLAAFRSVEEFTHRSLNVTVISTAVQAKQVFLPGSGRLDWLFWLSTESFPEEFLKAGAVSGTTSPVNIFRMEQGKEILQDTWIDGMPEIWIGRMIKSASTADQYSSVWKDGFGGALLALEKNSTGTGSAEIHIFHFYSRFDPAWNGLVWSPSFPLLLQQLIVDPVVFDPAAFLYLPDRDLRMLDPLQILPQQNQSRPASKMTSSTGTIDLARGTWVLIFILFLLERIISLSGSKKKSNG